MKKTSAIISSYKKPLFAMEAALLLSFTVTVFVRAYTLRRPLPQEPLSQSQKQSLEAVLNQAYPERTAVLRPLPYPVNPAVLDVRARSAIAVNMQNGCVLYEKNADEIIPPASMTKLFVMYVVFEEIKKGTVSLKDTVPLPPESWACNMPPHSSLMFLGKNQIVTLEELLTGLAVCSGNDAAYAVADYICGGMDAFIGRMNAAAEKLGLTKTHFVESSGYSEKNTTTAREMAAFARHYVDTFPETLSLFHSRLSYTYPQEHNLAPEDRGKPRAQDFSQGIPEHITMGIYQKNTNPLLGTLDGCNGLKTGYIDESGYNLALTITRGSTCILSVTMGGPGNSVQEGNAGRIHDGTEIMEWAFAAFREYENPALFREYSVPLVFAKTQRINLVPAYAPKTLSVPVTAAQNPSQAEKEVEVSVELPESIKGRVTAGLEYGRITYSINGRILQTIPLVAERTEKKANAWLCAADFFAQLALLF